MHDIIRITRTHTWTNQHKKWSKTVLLSRVALQVHKAGPQENYCKKQSFCDINGLVYHELALPGESVAGHFCVQAVHRLCSAVRSKQCDNWQGQWFLHHDKSISSDFWLFPALKMGPKGTCLATTEDINWIQGLNVKDSNVGRFDGASMYAHRSLTMKVIRLSVAIHPTITVQYHHSANVLTAHHIIINHFSTWQK
jgi:hypothetical protein